MSVEQEPVSVFDVDGTLLAKRSLLDAALFAQDPARDTVIDIVSQEVLEELAATEGATSDIYVQVAIKSLLRNAGRRAPEELLHISRRGGFWPNADSYRTFTPRLAAALQGDGHSLEAITYSPSFLAQALLTEEGIPVPGVGRVTFDHATGSIYGVAENGTLSGEAYTPGDKGRAFLNRHREGPEVAVGDTITDWPMLKIARFAIAFCPDAELREEASAAKATIIDEEDGIVTVYFPASGKRRGLETSELRTLSATEIIAFVHE